MAYRQMHIGKTTYLFNFKYIRGQKHTFAYFSHSKFNVHPEALNFPTLKAVLPPVTHSEFFSYTYFGCCGLSLSITNCQPNDNCGSMHASSL